LVIAEALALPEVMVIVIVEIVSWQFQSKEFWEALDPVAVWMFPHHRRHPPLFYQHVCYYYYYYYHQWS
jgi:hypothetical protein